jgi:hypothetical protein
VPEAPDAAGCGRRSDTPTYAVPVEENSMPTNDSGPPTALTFRDVLADLKSNHRSYYVRAFASEALAHHGLPEPRSLAELEEHIRENHYMSDLKSARRAWDIFVVRRSKERVR